MSTDASPGPRVSPATEQRLRQAMQRLLDGQPEHCDGTLTKANLAREASTSPATLYRAKEVLRDWDRQVTAPTPRNPAVAEVESQLAEANRRIRTLRRRNTDLRRQLAASITVTAELHALLAAERQANARRESPVSPLRPGPAPWAGS